MVLEGEATAVVGDDRFDLVAEDVTWVPSGVPALLHQSGRRA